MLSLYLQLTIDNYFIKLITQYNFKIKNTYKSSTACLRAFTTTAFQSLMAIFRFTFHCFMIKINNN